MLEEEAQEVAITIAFETGSPWIADTTLGSCRHLAKIGESTHEAFRSYVLSISMLELFRRFRDLDFSLSLSEALRRQRLALRADLAESALIVLAFYAIIFWKTMNPDATLGFVLATVGVFYVSLPRFFLGNYEKGRTELPPDLWIRRDSISGCLRLFCALTVLFYAADLFETFWPEPDPFLWRIPRMVFKVPLAFILVSFIWRGWETVGIVADYKNTYVHAYAYGWVHAIVRIYVPLFLIVALATLLPATVYDLLQIPIVALLICVLILALLWWLYTAWTGFFRRLREFNESRYILRKGVPESITTTAVYESCLELKTSRARCLYLEQLRRKRIIITGVVTDPPKELSSDPLVVEMLARLREQWHGLAA